MNDYINNEIKQMNPDDLVVIEKLNESFTTSRTQVTVGKIVIVTGKQIGRAHV